MNKVTIERGIELPVKDISLRYPFGQMKVGESFFIPDGKECNKVYSSYARYKLTKNKKFKGAFRKVDGGTRFWRVE